MVRFFEKFRDQNCTYNVAAAAGQNTGPHIKQIVLVLSEID